MFSVLLAVTKFQCDRGMTFLIRMTRRLLRYLLWMIMPETGIFSAMNDRGDDVSIEVAEKVIENHLIGLDDYPIDLLGLSKELTITTKDGRCLRVVDGKGVFDGHVKISEVWEPLVGVRAKKDG